MREFLELFEDAPQIALNIDLKYPKLPFSYRFGYDMDLLAEKVVELIEEFDIADRVVIESGSSRIIKKVIEAGGGKDKEFLVF